MVQRIEAHIHIQVGIVLGSYGVRAEEHAEAGVEIAGAVLV